MKKLLAIVLALVMALGMFSAFAETAWDGAYMDEDDFKAYIAYDLDVVFDSISEQLGEENLAKVEAAVEEGKAAIEAAATVAEVEAAYDAAYAAILACVPTADGLYTYKKLEDSERTNILGILERYAVTTSITGMSLYENGAYQMINPRITLGTENYITGYGFGTLPEGAITEDLEYETNPDWARYYHIMETSDPGTLNAPNDQGSQVGDMYSYMQATFFGTFMNETKDGYDWVPELAKTKPEAVNDEDGDGMATTWRWEIRTGEDDGLVYTTGSELESRQAFNGRPVALEDYEFGFKLILTQANQFYRGSEFATTKTGAVVGAKDYYNATENGYNDEAWEKVGLKAYKDEADGKNYFEITFTEEQTRFYAMYYGQMYFYQPIPQEFVELVTVKNYLGFNEDTTESPVDNALSVGPYYLERWDSDQQVVYKKNPNYVFADTKYSIPGIHDKIFPAAASDKTATFTEFLAGHFDTARIPDEYLNEYRNDPRTHTTKGNSVFKLNINACDAETWEYMFGTDGVVKQTAKEDYWDIKPCMGNHHFVQALSYSINRSDLAVAKGRVPSVNYLSSNYMSDPENGMSYDATEAHEKAVAGLLEDTDGYGYSLELARDYFRLALTELEAEGAYAPGTAEEPTEIHFEIAWMYPTDEEDYHNQIKNYIETAFNDESVSGGAYKLVIDYWVGNTWSDVYYNKLMLGQYDLGFGSISGNSLDPIGFVSVLSSDQDISGSFTLNWGVDTNDPDAYPIVYNDLRWSFDALYNAVNSQVIASKGQNKPQLTIEYTPIVKNEDGTYTGSFTVASTLPDITSIEVFDIECCNYERYYNGDGNYDEAPVEFEVEAKGEGLLYVTFTVPAELAEDYATGSGTSAEPAGDTGFDLYYNLTFNGSTSNGLYYSVTDNFEVPEVAEAEATEAAAE